MKKTLTVMFAFLMTAILSANAESGRNFFGWYVKGPTPNQTNRYNAFRLRVSEEIRTYGQPVTGVSNRLYVADIVQPGGAGNDTNEVLWFVFHIVSKGGMTNRIWANKCFFTCDTSDFNHYLRTSTSFTNANTVWGPGLVGIRWGGGIPRSNDTLYASAGSGKISDPDMDMDEVIGMAMIPHFIYNSQGELTSIDTYMMAPANVRLNSIWAYMEGSVTDGYVTKSLDTKYFSSFKPYYLLTANSSTATISINSEDAGTSVIVLHSHLVTGPWSILSTANHGDTLVRPAHDQHYYQLRSQ